MQVDKSVVFRWSIIVALGGFLFGFDTAVISGVEGSIQQVFNLTPFWQGFAVSSALFGTIAGALFGGQPADKYGRKPVLFVIALLFTFSAFGSALAFNLALFVAFRLIGGFAIGVSSVVAPMYIAEISPAAIRGRMTALFQFNVIFGILIAFVSNYLLSNVGVNAWRWMLAVGGAPAIVFFVLLFAIPESPRFLIKKDQVEKAKKVFARIHIPDIESEVRDIQLSLNVKNEPLFSGRFTKPITIAFLVAMFNQFSGINAVLYYAPRIFSLTGLSETASFLQPVGIGLTNAIFTILGLVIIDKFGRKRLLIVGSIGMAISLGMVAITFYLRDFSGYSVLLYLALYIMFFAFSTGAVIWVLISEVFPNSVRGKGQSLGSTTHWSFATIITFLFPVIVENYELGSAYAFTFFALMMVVQIFVVWKYFPETKGKKLEEISAELTKGYETDLPAIRS